MASYMPEYSAYPTTELQQILHAKGFTHFYSFPNEGCFYAALGFAIMLHTYPDYSAISTFMLETWRPKVAPLHKIEALHGDARYHKSEYWADMQQRCKDICLEIFAQKEHVRSKITADRMLDPDNRDYYNDIVRFFRVSLALHRIIENSPKTYHYASGNTGSSVVFVNLAMENGRVTALVHKDMTWGVVPKPVFPHYMQLHSKEPGSPQPLLLSRNDLQHLQDPRDALIRNLVKVTTLLSRVVLSQQTMVARTEEHTLEELKTSHGYMAPIVREHFPGVDFDSEELRRVLALPLEELPRLLAHRFCSRRSETESYCSSEAHAGNLPAVQHPSS